VDDITSGAKIYYTTDGSDPTNDGSSSGPIYSGTTLSVDATSNVTFKAVAFRDNYQNSGEVVQQFSPTNFVPNTISFGFSSGEASSVFVASPGQLFYAPVTMTVLTGVQIYSLQFNVTVTNAGPNPGPAVYPGAVYFESTLWKPDLTDPGFYVRIPPAMFVGVTTNLVGTNEFATYPVNPPPTNVIIYPFPGTPTTPFLSLEFVDSSLNLLGVGWLERAGETYLYDTTVQTLFKYTAAHDVWYPNSSNPGMIEVGDYAFWVPPTATGGQTYQIQIGRPSATSDGIGAPGSSVYIQTPTNGSLTAGKINATKIVTIGQLKYIVGDCYPFRWFNAGDFGDTNINNADVEQVFQSAVYNLNVPPAGSDFFDSMDSCGGFGTYNATTGYYTYAGPMTTNDEMALFNGDDSTINQIAFGDGVLDVCDVYVTFRRSEDSSLVWYERFWTNGVRVAQTVPNVVPQLKTAPVAQAKLQSAASATAASPLVNFAAGDFIGTAGEEVQIPITANIFGNYPLRLLMLNLNVVPLDGSPPLTVPVDFEPNPDLGDPYTAMSQGTNNYAAVWLDNTIDGLTGNANLGTLSVTIPTNATSSSAYAIHFDHASASPNGIASFPKQTLTGVITLSSRTNSSYNDGIPDLWRLRWFGTVDNLLSVSNACPSGDGIDNWEKFVAGVDPNATNDFPSVYPRTPAPTGDSEAIHWSSVSGVQYVVLRSGSLFPGNWTAISTNTGTGTDMEYDDTAIGKAWFYRVQILPP
jgi:hypothetical protein